MPLPKRLVEPVHVARGTIPEDFPLPSELEAATNGTLANTIRQLSSLSRHAEDLFGELAREAVNLSDRANSLQARIDRLTVKVTQLDSNVEEGATSILEFYLLLFCFELENLKCKYKLTPFPPKAAYSNIFFSPHFWMYYSFISCKKHLWTFRD